MAQRVALAKNVTAASGAQPSIRIRLADPPFTFITNAGWTGTVAVQESIDGPDVSDAAATWRTLLTIAPGDEQSWASPLYRIRADPASVASGNCTVVMLEGVRSLKNERTDRARRPTSRQTRESM